MRIAHVIDYFHTDVGYQEYYLAKAQAEAGHTVRVISSRYRHHSHRRPGPDASEGTASLVAAGVEVLRLRAMQLGHDRAFLFNLSRTLMEFVPDAIHCHGPFGPTAIRIAGGGKFSPTLVVDNHVQEAIAPASSTRIGRIGYAAFRATAGPVLRRSVDHWVANGPYEGEFLHQRLAVPRRDIKLIPLGFDPKVFEFRPETRVAHRLESRWNDDLVVAITGKVHEGKRPDLVARACERASLGTSIRLVIAGQITPTARATVESAAPSLTKQGRVEFRPMLGRHALAALYMASDIVVFAKLPSISIYEAAGTGVRLLVGQDDFADWLANRYPGVESVDREHFERHLFAVSDRLGRARSARAALSWPVISGRFMALYRGGDETLEVG